MQSMLERVGTRVLDHLDKPLSTMDLGERGLLALAIARAAIEAMREPTPKMLYESGGNYRGLFFDDEGIVASATEVWHAMIDAALK